MRAAVVLVAAVALVTACAPAASAPASAPPASVPPGSVGPAGPVPSAAEPTSPAPDQLAHAGRVTVAEQLAPAHSLRLLGHPRAHHRVARRLRAATAPQPLRPRRAGAGRVVRPRRLDQPVAAGPVLARLGVPRHGRRRPVGERDLPAGDPLPRHRAGGAGVGDRARDEQHGRSGRRGAGWPAGSTLIDSLRTPGARQKVLLGDAAPAAVVRRVEVALEPGRLQRRAEAPGRRATGGCTSSTSTRWPRPHPEWFEQDTAMHLHPD